jgi:outer membrane receptor protein involved in Fe transport
MSSGGSLPRIDIPPGTLADAIIRIGEQAGVTIALGDARLATIQVRGVHGRLPVATALDRMLAGTSARAVATGLGGYRIAARPAPHPTAPAPPSVIPASSAIVVTGSKRGQALASYPGSVNIADVARLPLAARVRGSDALVAELPILSSTHLGPGQNKLFIRGIADSSFNGPSPATVGQYLGEARITYNAPDPDLALYDIAEAEILEGPQGTLYGAGTLGGIVRLDPVMPNLETSNIGLSVGGATTQHAAASYDGAALFNLPLKAGTLGIRGLAYASSEGGFIDDPLRGLRDVNRTRTAGGRIELRYRPSADWTIDLTGVIQDIKSRDARYAERGLPAFERESRFAQPFDNDYALAGLVVRHAIGSAELTSSSTIVRHDLETVYDATLPGGPGRLFREDDHILFYTNETRLSRRYADGSNWVIGVEGLHSSDRIRRTLGPPDALAPISGSRNTVTEGALFGEATLSLTRRLSITGGGRLGYDGLTGEALDHPKDEGEPDRHTLVFLPSAGLSWKVAGALSIFARYQKGFRPGGLSVSDTSVQRFQGDSLATAEIGVRVGDAASRFQISAAASYARWRSVQADLVETDGLPMTTNIGNGRVVGVEAQARWRPIDAITVSGGLFINDSSLTDPAPGFLGEKDASLPNVDDVGLQARLDGKISIGDHDAIAPYAALRYYGGSKLGVGPVLDLPQGYYVDGSVGLRWTHRRIDFTVDVSNLFDDGQNQFALGNPFTVFAGRQIGPLRPRTVRFGLSTGF